MVAALTALTAPAGAAATPRYTVRSPQGALIAVITGTVRPRLTVRRAGRVVLRAELGRAGRASTRAGIARAIAHTSRLQDSYTTTAGKRREHTRSAERITLRLAQGARLELAVADDGIAFRQTGFADATVGYRPLPGSTGYLQRLVSNYEGAYPQLPVTAARGKIAYPALLADPAGTYTLLSETGLPYGTPGEHLTATARHPGVLSTETARGERAPRRTAWRLAVIGSPADIVQSDLATEFAAPSRIADTSWITPGRVAWSWWSGGNVTAGGLDGQERYVDFAASAGLEYVLVDAGWDASWVPALVAYAAQRGVRIILWTDYADIADPQARAATFDQWAAWGVAGVKADFFQSDSAARMAVMEDIARDAAARHMLVDFHGCTVPRGLQRTWPNVMTAEGVRGAEYLRNAGTELPANNVTLAFTRNAVASMDFTPVTFSARGRVSTAAAQLAQSIVFESGLQHYADDPASYEARPNALELIRQAPAAWDDVRYLDGVPGQWVTLARRSGQRWFIGSISATPARTATIPLRFLDAGRAYTARIYADGPADTIAVSRQPVISSSVLTLPVDADGGFSVVLTPAV